MQSDNSVKCFADLLESVNIIQHVQVPTHIDGHTIDVILTPSENHGITSTKTSLLLSDHMWVECVVDVEKPVVLPKTIIYRKYNTVTRGHNLKLKKECMIARQRRYYFRHRVVNRWNTLTEYVVSAPSLNIFKSRLDRFWCAYSFEQNDNFPPMRTNNGQDQLKGYQLRRAEEDVYNVCIKALTNTAFHNTLPYNTL